MIYVHSADNALLLHLAAIDISPCPNRLATICAETFPHPLTLSILFNALSAFLYSTLIDQHMMALHENFIFQLL